MTNYLKETELLNFSHPLIQALVKNEDWMKLDLVNRVKAIYNYVKNDIKFGYNSFDNIKATKVLEDGYGQCNTKSTLLMALLRATGVPNRIHGFTIDKVLQKGAINGVWYSLSPKNILHSWVEVYVNDKWYFLEGVILDKEYYSKLQEKFKGCKATFCGYGVFTSDFESPPVEWNLNNTFIQDKGINQDFGLFDSPDEFYVKHKQKLGWFKRFAFKSFIRQRMNYNVKSIRLGE